MAGRTFFVSASSAGRTNIFQSDRMQDLFVDVLRHYRIENKFWLHAFVMMSDHMHLLITPSPDLSLEKCVQLIKGGYSYRVKRDLSLTFNVWNPGFSKSPVKGQPHFQNVVNYIHMNPVKAGKVERPELYKCSSAWPGRRMDPSPFEARAEAQSR
jgi:putative transposase